MSLSKSTLIQDLKSLFDQGRCNALIDRYYRSHTLPELCFYREEYENVFLSCLESAPAGKTLSPDSLKKLHLLAEQLHYGDKFKKLLETRQNDQRLKNPPDPVGVTPLLLADPGTDKGYITELKISLGSGERHQLLNRAAALIQGYFQQKCLPEIILDPDDYVCELVGPTRFGFEKISGDSLGLSLLLALFSCLCETPLPVGIAASAVLGPGGDLLPVSGIAAKMAALKSERYYVKKIIVAENQECPPPPAGLEISRYASVFELLPEIFPPAACKNINLPLNVEKTMDLIKKQSQNQQWDICIGNASTLLNSAAAKAKKAALFTVYTIRGAAFCHQGKIRQSQADYRKAEKLYRQFSRVIDKTAYFDMLNHKGVALKDVFRYDEARKVHEKNREEFERLGADAETRARNISSLSQLLCAQGDFAVAVKLQKEAISLLRRAGADLARNYGYLVDIQTRAGNFDAAGRALKKAREYPDGRPQGHSAPFLDWYEAQLLYRRLEKSGNFRTALFKKLLCLRAQYPQMTFHAPALVHKYAGLAELYRGDRDETATKNLDNVIDFLSQQADSTYQILAASVRIERRIILLDRGNYSLLQDDIDKLTEHLENQPGSKRFFAAPLAALKDLNRKLGKTVSGLFEKSFVNEVDKNFILLRNKIPY